MLFSIVLATIEAEKTLGSHSIFDLLLRSDPVVKLALILLILFSVGSWAIIFLKYSQLGKSQKASQNFWNVFARAKSLSSVREARQVRSGPLYELFQAALDIVPQLKESPVKNKKEHLENKLMQAREEEIYKLEQYTSFLATTASTAPFIGLFGTVWGILTAFWAIGKAGSSSLATVGPYISEALVATAVGLAAAIPAVIFYNYFIRRIRTITKMMDLYLEDLILRIQEETNL